MKEIVNSVLDSKAPCTLSIKKTFEIPKALKMPQMAINDQIKKANLKFRVEVAV